MKTVRSIIAFVVCLFLICLVASPFYIWSTGGEIPGIRSDISPWVMWITIVYALGWAVFFLPIGFEILTEDDFKKKIGDNISKLSFEEKKAIVRLLVSEVVVDTSKDKITVRHTVPDSKSFPLCPGSIQPSGC